MNSKLAIGLMSGTSRDGIDAALIRSDGENFVESIAFHSVEYDAQFQEDLAITCGQAMAMDYPKTSQEIKDVERGLTEKHAEAVNALLDKARLSPQKIDVIGFHGHTVGHKPDKGWTWQIGDGARLAALTDINVVNDLRGDDVRAGGQGAPLLPVYHRVLSQSLDNPVGILNLGGVGNITYVGENDELIAFDTGMASALINEWMLKFAGKDFDEGGNLAATGQIDEQVLADMLNHPYFDAPAPKSLDRTNFSIEAALGLSLEDGAATLTAFSVHAVERALRLLPQPPKQVFVAGGGRHNHHMMRLLASTCGLEIRNVDELGWNGDALEAEGFAYMALRSLNGLSISFPGTTGAPEPMTGGTLHTANV